MKYGIISDIHSNFFALQAGLEFLEGKIDVLLFVGDVVGYGPQPKECIEALVDYPLKKYSCLGNHDLGVRYRYGSKNNEDVKEDFNIIKTFKFRGAAMEMLDRNADEMDNDHYHFLKSLEFRHLFTLESMNIYLVHGAPADNQRANVSSYLRPPPIQRYDLLIHRLEEDNNIQDPCMIITGHTHQRFIATRDKPSYWSLIGDKKGSKTSEFPKKFVFEPDEGKIILNPGSIGQPRDGSGSTVSLVILDLEENCLEFHNLSYPTKDFYNLTKDKCVQELHSSEFWGNEF
ncbi:MAG: metallophosphoesterase family protein [Candidatus Hodarchaeales archaeon]